MHNAASILVLLFLAVTFIQSGYDKIVDWKGNVDWLKGHFANTPIKDQVPASLGLILLLEVASGVCTLAGALRLGWQDDSSLGKYGAILSCVTLIFLLLGQRMAKDYDGARTIAIYFVPAVLAVFWLN